NRCLEIEAKTRQPTWAHPGGAVGLASAARLAETRSSACAAYGSTAPDSASRPYAERSSSSPSVMVGPKCRQLGNHHLGHRALCPASGSQYAQPSLVPRRPQRLPVMTTSSRRDPSAAGVRKPTQEETRKEATNVWRHSGRSSLFRRACAI